jgi:predicted cupin superfamily sugar epimerase
MTPPTQEGLSAHTLSAHDVIRLLDLKPHPEGGHYRETFRDAGDIPGGRGASTAIYFLLKAGERSHWHRVDAAEVWHFYAGAPLELSQAESGDGPVTTLVLGPDLKAGQRPQAVVPADVWQAAESLGAGSQQAWTLVGCTVAPAFVFPGFELAPKGWAPKG